MAKIDANKNFYKRSFERQGVRQVSNVALDTLKVMGLTTGMNKHKIFKAWDELSNARNYTLDKNFYNGVLTCKISSSVVRSALYRMKDEILNNINVRLINDPMFDKNNKFVGLVEKIVLK